MSLMFRDRLSQAIHALNSRWCMGIDPHRENLTGFFAAEKSRLGETAFVIEFVRNTIEAASGRVPAVKFQSAFFEALGVTGLELLRDGVRMAKQNGLITILDAKRGDISSTMQAYGEAAFDVIGADALTITPWMGLDVLDALVPWLKRGKGVYIVWLTSNPSGAEFQDRLMADQRPLRAHVLETWLSHAQKQEVSNAIGWVCGATRFGVRTPAEHKLIVGQPLLIPGVGEQGGVISEDLKSLVQQCPESLYASSRGLTGLGSKDARWTLVSRWDEWQEVAASLVGHGVKV